MNTMCTCEKGLVDAEHTNHIVWWLHLKWFLGVYVQVTFSSFFCQSLSNIHNTVKQAESSELTMYNILGR